MAKISYENISFENNSNQGNVGFFNLKQDGEEAIVRFMIDSVQDMDLQTIHNIRLDGKFREVSCLRNPMDDMNVCPLCAQGVKVQQAFYIRLLKYTQDENGGIRVEPMVWKRNASVYAPKLKGYLDNYGPLSNIVCKIIRHGKPGDMKTTYDIIPALNPQEYTAERFPIDKTAFEDFSVLGRMVLEKTYEELSGTVNTDNGFISPETTTGGNGNMNQFNNVQPTSMNEVPNTNFGNNPPQMERPQRYY